MFSKVRRTWKAVPLWEVRNVKVALTRSVDADSLKATVAQSHFLHTTPSPGLPKHSALLNGITQMKVAKLTAVVKLQNSTDIIPKNLR